MTKTRLEAFSDGVIAILITIMVLELHAPHDTTWSALSTLLPTFLSYVLSFVYVGIYWNNHHHMLHAASHISGAVLWANHFLLFWLSLVPFATHWMGEDHAAALPTLVYGIVMFACAMAYTFLQNCLISVEGNAGRLKEAIGADWKGRVSGLLYVAAIALAYVNTAFSQIIYASVAVLWFLPDRRLEPQRASGLPH